ncbi:hypothetical protein ABZ119_27115 [Streptomyces sp. NPDC006288]|uniref:hypothetical protein n=1 Tax=Streptomyces sp. NPDC006288 TaxID=3156743 RepID=UPI0033A46CCD
MNGPENRHDDDRTGNGIVNDGLDGNPNTDPEQDGERKQDKDDSGAVDGAEAAPTAAGGGGAPAGGPVPGAGEASGDGGPGGTLTALFGAGTASTRGGDFGRVPRGVSDAGEDAGKLDEAELRRMLRGAVHGLEPSDGTLDHLCRAVPARRARRRQAVVGAAAAALLIGTAVPAFVHVANSDGSVTADPAIAGHGQQAQGGSGEDAGSGSGVQESAGPEDHRSAGAEGEGGDSSAPAEGSDPDAEGSGSESLDNTPGGKIAAAAACDPGQLGIASAEAGAAGANGTVYGTFRIANVSGSSCSVTTNGTVGFQAAGAADPLKISVVQHTAGDPAGGLPDPSLEPGTVFLKPAMAYEVRFAWVPSDTCPTTGGSPSPTPTDGVGGGGDSTGTTAGTADTAAQFGSADEGPADGSIAVTHTPETGAPTAETTISNACAGTIYRTGVLEAS